MKNKSTLVMIEHIVMLLVFVLAATVCVRMFVLSEKLSRKYEATDMAALIAQNTAELLKKGGVPALSETEGAVQTGEGVWAMFYDKNWETAEQETAEFTLIVKSLPESSPFLFRAEITVLTEAGEELFRLPIAGQKETEVATDETV